MAYTAFGSPEHGGPGGGGLFASVFAASTSIVAAPAGFPGSYAFQVDPVNGQVFTDFYGWTVAVGMPANLLAIPFVYRTAADFQAAISIAELSVQGDLARRISQNNTEGLGLVDASENSIAATADNYIVAGSVYRILWLIDIRNPSETQDALWVYRPVQTLGPVANRIAFSKTASPDTITDSGNGLGLFAAGDVITIAGSVGGNNGPYTIVTATPGTLTLGEDVLNANEAAGVHNITISSSAHWDNPINEVAHGDIGRTGLNKTLTFGTFVGKGLPNTGGPFQVTNMLLNSLNELPFNDALGSINTRYKPAIGDGQDMDFTNGVDGGGGWGNPDRRNVNQIPADDATTYDEGPGGGSGAKQSYEIDTPSGADAPLAVHSYVRAGVIVGTTTGDIYIHDGTSDDQRGSVLAFATWADGGAMYADINGVFFTDLNDAGKIALFNSLEIGLEDTDVNAIRLTAAGIHYFVEGALALPDDWPDIIISIDFRQTITPGPQSVAVSPNLIF